jgi:hypothetical protein
MLNQNTSVYPQHLKHYYLGASYTAQKANTGRSLAPNWIKLERGRDMTHNNNNGIDS